MKYLRRVGEVDIRPIAEEIIRNYKLFNEYTFRQDHPDSPHKNTETIYIRMCPNISVWDLQNSMESSDWHEDKFPKTLEIIEEFSPLRVMVAKLHPDSEITAHADEGYFAENTDRYHIPIIANDTWFHVAHEKAEMKQGEVWWFDKQKEHWVKNLSNDPRIHIIFDVRK